MSDVADYNRYRALRNISYLEVVRSSRPTTKNAFPNNTKLIQHTSNILNQGVMVEHIDFCIVARLRNGFSEFVCSSCITSYDGVLNLLHQYNVSAKFRGYGFHKKIMAVRSAVGSFSNDETDDDYIISSTHPMFEVPAAKLRKLGASPISEEKFEGIMSGVGRKILASINDDFLESVKDSIFSFDSIPIRNIIEPSLEELAEARIEVFDGFEYRSIPILYVNCHILDGDADDVYNHIAKRIGAA